jgi:hypothetical protein
MSAAAIPTTALDASDPALAIVATGTPGDRRRVFAVESRSGTAAARALVFHLCTLENARVSCNCPAARFGRECAHVRTVRRFLADEAAALRALIRPACPQVAEDASWYRRFLMDEYPAAGFR